MRRSIPLAAVVSAIVAATCFLANEKASAASAYSPSTTGARATITAQVLQRQNALEHVARRLEKLSVSDPRYSSISIDAQTNTITIRRTGEPDRGREATYRAWTRDAIRPRPFHQSPILKFARSLLTAKQEETISRFVEAKAGLLRSRGTSLSSWGPTPDDRAFQINYSGVAPPRTFVESLREYGQGHVLIVRGSRTVALSRFDDGPPYYGGAVVKWRTGFECSSGFGAISPHGVTYLLTAGHCVNPSDSRMFTGGNHFIGRVVAGDRDLDTAYIQVRADHRIYDGALGAPEFSKNVVGNPGYTQGALVCTSGAVMRAVCGDRIVARLSWTSTNAFNGVSYVSHGYEVANIDSQPTSANGDSGGPVFSIFNGGSSGEVLARGIVSAAPANAETRCPTSLSGHHCFNVVYAVDTSEIGSRRDLAFTW